MLLTSGSAAPVLATTDSLGRPVDLRQLLGRRVLLSFYRYASCPVCNLRMREVIQAYPQWAEAGLEVIAVFQSPNESIARYVGRQDAPFPIVGDPTLVFYRSFGLEARWRGLFTWRVIRDALRAFGQGFAPGKIEGPMHRVPADFLIDESGCIAVAHYGGDIGDHLPMGVINKWLQPQDTKTGVIGRAR